MELVKEKKHWLTSATMTNFETNKMKKNFKCLIDGILKNVIQQDVDNLKVRISEFE